VRDEVLCGSVMLEFLKSRIGRERHRPAIHFESFENFERLAMASVLGRFLFLGEICGYVSDQ
jgi:hypothetical protein